MPPVNGGVVPIFTCGGRSNEGSLLLLSQLTVCLDTLLAVPYTSSVCGNTVFGVSLLWSLPHSSVFSCTKQRWGSRVLRLNSDLTLEAVRTWCIARIRRSLKALTYKSRWNRF